MRELKSRRLGRVRYHEWIEFLDESGRHYAEPEAFILFDSRLFLIEVKLTGGPLGREQMEGLYAPLLSFIHGRPVHSLLVCRNRTVDTPGPFFSGPEEFLASGESFGTWHWLGR